MAKFSFETQPDDEYPGVNPGVTLIIEDDLGAITRHHMTPDKADHLGEMLCCLARVATKRALRFKQSQS